MLYDLINTDKKEDRKVFFVHGGVDAEEREPFVKSLKEKLTQLLLHLMERFQLESISKTSITLFLPLLQSLGLEISKALEEHRKGTNKTKTYSIRHL